MRMVFFILKLYFRQKEKIGCSLLVYWVVGLVYKYLKLANFSQLKLNKKIII